MELCWVVQNTLVEIYHLQNKFEYALSVDLVTQLKRWERSVYHMVHVLHAFVWHEYWRLGNLELRSREAKRGPQHRLLLNGLVYSPYRFSKYEVTGFDCLLFERIQNAVRSAAE